MTEAVAGKSRGFRVLVAPLDWGLGHATRCVPVIRELLQQGCEVWLGAEGNQRVLLETEFPALPVLPLDGYRIHYSRSRQFFSLNILSQAPGIVQSITREHRWLKRMIRKHQFDAVISDNRFGLYHSKTPCVFITHQLAIRSRLGGWADGVLRIWNYRFINRFKVCWVPDFEGEPNLSGELSHPLRKPKCRLRYLGPLSRFERKEEKETEGHLLIILSGPEPQRTKFENKIVSEIGHYPGTATVVRGVPSSPFVIPSTGMIKFYNHLPTSQLNDEMQKAEWVISRSGYSTVMDIVRLKKKSILVPTPGQTEQEYLGDYLGSRRIAYAVSEKDFSLDHALKEAKQFNYQMPEISDNYKLQSAVSDLLAKLHPTV